MRFWISTKRTASAETTPFEYSLLFRGIQKCWPSESSKQQFNSVYSSEGKQWSKKIRQSFTASWVGLSRNSFALRKAWLGARSHLPALIQYRSWYSKIDKGTNRIWVIFGAAAGLSVTSPPPMRAIRHTCNRGVGFPLLSLPLEALA